MTWHVLSVRQPYAGLIIGKIGPGGCKLLAVPHTIKDIENRSRRTQFRGRLYIHASLQVHERFKHMWHIKGYPSGVIIGHVDLVDCVQTHESAWHEEGMWGWVLENPVAIEPIPAKGKLGIWKYEVAS